MTDRLEKPLDKISFLSAGHQNSHCYGNERSVICQVQHAEPVCGWCQAGKDEVLRKGTKERGRKKGTKKKRGRKEGTKSPPLETLRDEVRPLHAGFARCFKQLRIFRLRDIMKCPKCLLFHINGTHALILFRLAR